MTDILRVLVIAPSLRMLGGQSRQCARLLERLRKEPSLHVDFLPSNPQFIEPLGFLHRVKYLRTIISALVFWCQLLWRIPRYDVVHVFSAAFYAYLLFAMPPILVGRLWRKTVILNYRSGEAPDHLAHWRTAIPSMRLATAIVVPSPYLVEVFAGFGLKASFIYNMVELERFTFRQRSPLRPQFLTTRLLEPLYNVPCVLRAFRGIQERYPSAALRIGGEGFLRPELEALAKQLSLKNIEFIGRTPFEEMPRLYDSAEIYLTATNLDNMPSSITECLASGLPVVTTNAGGIPFIVEHEKTCLMVEKNDDVAMAAEAIRLLEQPELASKIANNGRIASRQWTWEAVGAKWLELYQSLAVRS